MIIEGSLDQINENDLIELENQININIPEQYRNFLLRNNGGKPKINRFTTQDK